MDWHKYQKLLYWKDFVMNCFCFQIICDHLIVMRYFVMGDHVMAINVPTKCPAYAIRSLYFSIYFQLNQSLKNMYFFYPIYKVLNIYWNFLYLLNYFVQLN